MPVFLAWKQFLGDEIINDGSPRVGSGGLLAPLPHWSGGGVGLLEALTRPAHADWDCE